jgi:hypothetical protein
MAYIGHTAETADWSKIWPENLRKEKGKKIYIFFLYKRRKKKEEESTQTRGTLCDTSFR